MRDCWFDKDIRFRREKRAIASKDIVKARLDSATSYLKVILAVPL